MIHEDGPYGTGCAAADEQFAKQFGIQVLMDEAYSAQTSDLSSLVTKLKRANADVILHTGYNPDITLFLRQAREAGLRFKMLIGHGAGDVYKRQHEGSRHALGRGRPRRDGLPRRRRG